MSERKRIQWLDVMRGIGIIIMIMGHVGFGGIFDRWIHSFHMPLFFLISGYLYGSREKILKQFAYRKFRTLLVPYLVFIAINYFVWIILVHDCSWQEPLIEACTNNTHGLPIAGACWFLTAMFFTEIIYCLLQKVLRDERAVCIVVMILAVGMSFLSTQYGVTLPLALSQGIVGAGFLQLGRLFSFYLKKQNAKDPVEKSAGYCILVGGILLAANIVLSFVNGYVNVKEGWYSNIFLFWINAVLGIVACAFLAIAFEKLFHRMSSILIKIGRNSIIYLGLNQLVILMICKLGIPYTGNQGALSIANLAGSMLITIGTVVVLMLISHLFMSSRLKVIFGK